MSTNHYFQSRIFGIRRYSAYDIYCVAIAKIEILFVYGGENFEVITYRIVPAWNIRCLGRLESERAKCKRKIRRESIQAISKQVFAPNVFPVDRYQMRIRLGTCPKLRSPEYLTNNFILLFAYASGHSVPVASIKASMIDFDLERN